MIIILACIAVLLVAILSVVSIIAYNKLTKGQFIKMTLIGLPISIVLIVLIVFHDFILGIPVLGAILKAFDDFVSLFYSYVGGMVIPFYLWVAFIPTLAFIWYSIFAILEYRKIKANYEKEVEKIAEKFRKKDEEKLAKQKENEQKQTPTKVEAVKVSNDWNLKLSNFHLDKKADVIKAFKAGQASNTLQVEATDTGYRILVSTPETVIMMKQLFSQYSLDLSALIDESMMVEVDVANGFSVVNPLATYVQSLGV